MRKYLITLAAGIFVVGGVALATDIVQQFYGNTTVNLDGQAEENIGAFPGPEIYQDIVINGSLTVTEDLNVGGALTYKQKIVASVATDQYATTTLTIAQSGTTFLISASGTQFTLPASTTAEVGTTYRFQVNGAIDTGSSTIASYEGDNIEGSIMIAGAVVDCDAADNVELDYGKENIGDYVEVMWGGTYWLVQDSNFLTSLSAVCQG